MEFTLLLTGKDLTVDQWQPVSTNTHTFLVEQSSMPRTDLPKVRALDIFLLNFPFSWVATAQFPIPKMWLNNISFVWEIHNSFFRFHRVSSQLDVPVSTNETTNAHLFVANTDTQSQSTLISVKIRFNSQWLVPNFQVHCQPWISHQNKIFPLTWHNFPRRKFPLVKSLWSRGRMLRLSRLHAAAAADDDDAALFSTSSS